MKRVSHKHALKILKTASLMIMGGAVCFGALAQAADLPKHQVKMQTDAEYRYIMSNGIPNHGIGAFPNAQNSNVIKPQNYAFRMPLKPEHTDKSIAVGSKMFFGVALNGVPFGLGREELWDGKPEWRFEALSDKIEFGQDQNNGDALPGGAYQYLGIPAPLLSKDFIHVGYAADGFPIFVSKSGKFESSYRLKTGARPAPPLGPGGVYDGTFTGDYHYVAQAGNLDQCNGVLANGKYYIYVLTKAFPYVPRCWSGTADNSFVRPDAVIAAVAAKRLRHSLQGLSHREESLLRRGRAAP